LKDCARLLMKQNMVRCNTAAKRDPLRTSCST
jgi:hypothetical protein